MDVELIVNKLEEFHLIRTNRVRGDWYSVYCPFHNEGKERRPSCGVLLHDQYKGGQLYPEGLWHCFTCGIAYSMQDAVSNILRINDVVKSGKDWLVENVPGFLPDADFDPLVSEDIINYVDSKFAVTQIQNMHEPVSYVSEEELSRYRYTVPYMYERKLTDEIINEYDVGVDLNWVPPGRSKKVPCITFPVHDQLGNTLFICRRSIEGKLYNYPEGVTKPVYGLDKIPKGCKSVIICESIINALTARVWGYPAVALLGTSNDYQIKQLRNLGVNEFVLGMDGDEAGRRAARKLKKRLRDVAIVWEMHLPDGKDINDLDQDTFEILYRDKD